jgi:phosphoglycerol transferase
MAATTRLSKIGAMLNSPQSARYIKYMLISLVSLVITCYIMDFFSIPQRVPLLYNQKDDFVHATIAKNFVQNTDVWTNERLGLPGESELYSFPYISLSFLLICKFLSAFSSDIFLILNFYYIVTFVLCSFFTYYTLNKIGFSDFSAATVALIFPFCQYHYGQHMSHVTASSFYSIPIYFYFCYKLVHHDWSTYKWKDIKWIDIIRYLILSFIAASADIIYAFFGCFFLLVVIMLNILKKQKKNVLAGVCCLSGIILTEVIILFPALVNNLDAASRHNAYMSVYFSFQIASLFAPINSNHPLHPFSDYLISAQITQSENLLNYAGLIGIIGFFLLLLGLLYNRWISNQRLGNAYMLAVQLNIFSILLATAFGFQIFVASFLSSVRTYCRIYVYIFFFCLVAVAMALDHISLKIKRWISIALAIFMVIFNLLDSSFGALLPRQQRDRFYNDKEFVQEIESIMPEGASVFQLPYVAFPENDTNNNQLIKGYLLSEKLRWSAGAVEETHSDQLVKSIASKDSGSEFLAELKHYGFSGVYIDTSIPGFWNDANAYQKLHYLLDYYGGQCITDTYEEIFFFDITNPPKSGDISELLHMLIQISSYENFYSEENDGADSWRWSRRNSSLTIYNPTDTISECALIMTMNSYDPDGATISLSGISEEELRITARPEEYILNVDLLPGNNVLNFTSDGKDVDPETDPRELNICFRSIDFDKRAVNVLFGEGFYREEKDVINYWRWSQKNSLIVINNPFDEVLEYSLTMEIYSLEPQGNDIQISGAANAMISVTPALQKYQLQLTLQPGENELRFLSGVDDMRVSDDERSLNYCMLNYKIEQS